MYSFSGMEIKKRRSPIVIAAPHEGDALKGRYDGNSGLIARMLSDSLKAKLVLARNLRDIVDVNKDPETASNSELAKWCYQYQHNIFINRPELVVEIHGHISGHYDLEISTGYYLIDPRYHRKLKAFHKTAQGVINGLWLPGSLFEGIKKPTLGIYPLDTDVKLKATRTYTFQIIKAMRFMGLNCYGLHIEINRYLRLPQHSEPCIQRAVVSILHAGIKRLLQA